MTQEVLKLALEALTIQSDRVTEIGKQREAITAIKEALRENAMREVQRLGQEIEQEPMKYSDYEPDGVHHNKPPQRTWVGLTDEEIDSYFEDQGWSPSKDYYPVIKAIEAKLKEKNT